MTERDWEVQVCQYLTVFLNGDGIPDADARGQPVTDNSFLLCFNANDKPQDFVTPKGDYAKEWTATLDTADATGSTELVVTAGKKISLQARSLLVLRKTA